MMKCYQVGCEVIDELRHQLTAANERIANQEKVIETWISGRFLECGHSEQIAKMQNVVAESKKVIALECKEDFGCHWCESCNDNKLCKALAELEEK